MFQLYGAVVNDVAEVIQQERAMQCIAVGDDRGEDGKENSNGSRAAAAQFERNLPACIAVML